MCRPVLPVHAVLLVHAVLPVHAVRPDVLPAVFPLHVQLRETFPDGVPRMPSTKACFDGLSHRVEPYAVASRLAICDSPSS